MKHKSLYTVIEGTINEFRAAVRASAPHTSDSCPYCPKQRQCAAAWAVDSLHLSHLMAELIMKEIEEYEAKAGPISAPEFDDLINHIKSLMCDTHILPHIIKQLTYEKN